MDILVKKEAPKETPNEKDKSTFDNHISNHHFIGFISFSGAEDTQTRDDNYFYFTAKSVEVRVRVWPVDQSGNNGEKLWEGVIKKGEKN